MEGSSRGKMLCSWCSRNRTGKCQRGMYQGIDTDAKIFLSWPTQTHPEICSTNLPEPIKLTQRNLTFTATSVHQGWKPVLQHEELRHHCGSESLIFSSSPLICLPYSVWQPTDSKIPPNRKCVMESRICFSLNPVTKPKSDCNSPHTHFGGRADCTDISWRT